MSESQEREGSGITQNHKFYKEEYLREMGTVTTPSRLQSDSLRTGCAAVPRKAGNTGELSLAPPKQHKRAHMFTVSSC